MIYVSFVELFPIANDFLVRSQGHRPARGLRSPRFSGWFFLHSSIFSFLPTRIRTKRVWSKKWGTYGFEHLERVGVLTALAIGIHNFPEGLATFFRPSQSSLRHSRRCGYCSP